MILRYYNIFIDDTGVVFNRLLNIIDVCGVLRLSNFALLSYITIIINNTTFKDGIIINSIIIQF